MPTGVYNHSNRIKNRCKFGHNIKNKVRLLNSTCRVCHNKRVKRWALKNRGKYKSKYRSYNIRKYGITIKDYEILYKKQHGKCLGCDKKYDKLCIDHCHNTKIVRGLLCSVCNLALGYTKDNPQILMNLINYLKGVSNGSN